MAAKTVLVTGATGLLGREVKRSFWLRGWEAKGTGYSRADGVDILKVDLGNATEVAKVLDETRYVRATPARPCDVTMAFSLCLSHILSLILPPPSQLLCYCTYAVIVETQAETPKDAC